MAKKRSSNKWLYGILGVVLILIIFIIVARSAGWIGTKRTLEVEVAEAKKVSITEKVSASGMVQPVVEVKLSPEVSGELIELNVEEGDSVVEGAILAKIRPDNFVAAVEQSEAALNQQIANKLSADAALARAKATFLRAQQEYDRQKKLHEEKVISESEWEIAQQNYNIAQNDLKSAEQSLQAANYIVKSSQASLSQTRENLRRTTVTAPMSGIVSKLNVEAGETVLGTQQNMGTEIMRIADLDKMEVRVDVNENDIIRVSVGDTAIIDVDSYAHLNKEFKGVVTSIANTANDKATTDAVTEFEVKIQILNSSYEDLVNQGNRFPFRPGMTASVDIITQRKDNVLTVPLSAVTTREDVKKDSTETNTQPEQPTLITENEAKEVVFLMVDGKAQLQQVETGISDFNNIEIISGVSEGDQVISGPFLMVSKRLKDGDAVSVKSAGSKPATSEAEAEED
jgi:HlyD family secretion protein